MAMKNTVPTGDTDSSSQSDVVRATVRRRMRKAFPELSAWFAWLNGGYFAGAKWESLLVTYIGRIGQSRVERLRREVRDAQNMGPSDELDLDVLVCNVLGLDERVLISEAKTPGGLLADFEHALPELVS